MTKPLIHYIWVGPAPAIKNSGMDTVGPDLMRQNDPEQDIHFYCFDSEVGRYQAYFDQRHAGKKSIVVHGIESYVDKVDVIFYPKDKMKYIGSPFKKPILSPLPDENLNLKLEFQSFIKKLKDRAESFDNAKDKVREWITIKASFDFFIQIYESGFVLDTNVIPDFITRRPIKVPEGFACTYWFNSRGQENPDANIMYNPVADEAALIRFANYFYGVSLFLPFCESGEQSFPQESVQMLDKIDGNPTVRLMIIAGVKSRPFL
jgi:hypothetical protein